MVDMAGHKEDTVAMAATVVAQRPAVLTLQLVLTLPLGSGVEATMVAMEVAGLSEADGVDEVDTRVPGPLLELDLSEQGTGHQARHHAKRKILLYVG